MFCKSCMDYWPEWKCPKCKTKPDRCPTCHDELAHGKIVVGPPIVSRPGPAETGGGFDRDYHGDNSRDNR